EWFAREGGAEPWCTTVSLVNPHDIAWWYRWSDRVATEASASRVATELPPNYETPELLQARRKPRLQHSLQETAAASFGPVPFSGPGVPGMWLQFLDLYVKLQREADRNVGRVLRTLASKPHIAANTVIVFSSDHGEYALHATAATVTEFAIEPFAADAPLHVVALRTASAKYSSYPPWSDEGITPQLAGEENELYDYSTEGGRLELHNHAGESPLEP